LNNTRNRPLRESGARTYAQDILNRHWAFNGETIIVGKSGQTLSGQHRLVALILAEQIRTGKQSLHWEDKWPGPVTMDCIIVFGVDESSETIRTLDNVIPRTLADVLFCDASVFGKVAPGDRKTLCRMTDYAIKYLWHRVNRDEDAFSPRRTHSESLDFIDRHPRLLRAVKHVWEENQPGKDDDGKTMLPPIGQYVPPGYASAMLYLMASCGSDGDKYHNADSPSEKKLNWDAWDKACEFWVLLGSGAKDFIEVHYAFAALVDPETGGGRGSLEEQACIVAKAWAAFYAGEKITKETVRLEYATDKDGMKLLNETAHFGGIDRVEDDAPASEPSEDGDGSAGEDDPTPEQIEAGKAEARKRRSEEIAATIKARRAAKNQPSPELELEYSPAE
jgi:hypothetical protein